MVLNMQDYLLACIGEEAGEVQQEIDKALRFGLPDINPDTDDNNWRSLRHEIHDLVAIYELLCSELNRKESFDRSLIDSKKERLSLHMNYSRNVGRLSKAD